MPPFKINYINNNIQSNGSDCGVFTILNATLCNEYKSKIFSEITPVDLRSFVFKTILDHDIETINSVNEEAKQNLKNSQLLPLSKLQTKINPADELSINMPNTVNTENKKKKYKNKDGPYIASLKMKLTNFRTEFNSIKLKYGDNNNKINQMKKNKLQKIRMLEELINNLSK